MIGIENPNTYGLFRRSLDNDSTQQNIKIEWHRHKEMIYFESFFLSACRYHDRFKYLLQEIEQNDFSLIIFSFHNCDILMVAENLF